MEQFMLLTDRNAPSVAKGNNEDAVSGKPKRGLIMPSASSLSEFGIRSPNRFSNRTGRLSPEKRLMLAVLLDAVECFQKHAPSHHAPSRPTKPDPLFTDAATWIFADDSESLFSFINICEAVGMNAQYLRRIISHGQAGTMLQGRRSDPKKVRKPKIGALHLKFAVF